MLCYILYVFASFVIFSFRKALKQFKKTLGHSLFYSQFVILTSLPRETVILLSSEKPFSTPGNKINFWVFEAQR